MRARVIQELYYKISLQRKGYDCLTIRWNIINYMSLHSLLCLIVFQIVPLGNRI